VEDIINWLIDVEKKACRVFTDAASLCKADPKLKRFFGKMADDETTHYHIMSSAAYHFKDYFIPPDQLVIDYHTKMKVETPLKKIEQLLRKNDFNKSQIVNCIIESELSEWNHIFRYVVNAMKSELDEFKSSIPKIQNHLMSVEHFCEQNEEYKKGLEKIRAIPKIWEERILIVEDFEPLREIFKDILSAYGKVDTAENGDIAKEKAFSTYYAFIITDIDLPQLNGIEFYKALVERHPEAKQRVAFMSGNCSQDRIQFFKENNLIYREKPISVKEIKEIAFESLERISTY